MWLLLELVFFICRTAPCNVIPCWGRMLQGTVLQIFLSSGLHALVFEAWDLGVYKGVLGESKP